MITSFLILKISHHLTDKVQRACNLGDKRETQAFWRGSNVIKGIFPAKCNLLVLYRAENLVTGNRSDLK